MTDAAGTIYLDVSMRLSSQFYTDVLLVLFQPILCLLSYITRVVVGRGWGIC